MAAAGLRTKHSDKASIGLVGHVVADFPSADAARSMIKNMASAGVSVIEVQIPFSEPVADGPVFMAANHEALQRGVGLDQAFALVNDASKAHPQVDFVFMTYLNVVYKCGYRSFAERAKAAGARGLIVPDLPIEYGAELDRYCRASGIDLIRLVAPNTDAERLALILRDSSGFVYAVARSGVTGDQTALTKSLAAYSERIRQHTKTPIGLGFGIRTAEDIKGLLGVADYAIIGTAALQAWLDGGDVTHRNFWEKISKSAGVLPAL